MPGFSARMAAIRRVAIEADRDDRAGIEGVRITVTDDGLPGSSITGPQ